MTFEAIAPRFGEGVQPGRIRIFDTTLRDGEQAPGGGLRGAEKLEVARQLARLKVDVIEAGFPAASPGDFEAVQRIARETKGGVAVAALARCRDGDPQRAVEAIRVAERPHLHVFIATSDIHLKHKLRISREEALAEAVRWVRYGREALGADAEIEFSAEDASRTDTEFLMQVYESLEEVVMALRTRPTQFPELGSGVQTERITPASRLVSYLTGFAIQPNKAVVGGNAFAHESGIHQEGGIKNPLTYE